MVVVEPSDNVDVSVTGTSVVERLSDAAGALAPALVLSVAPAVGAGELESASEVVYRTRISPSGQVRGSKVRTASSVDDGSAEVVSVADTSVAAGTSDEVEVALGSVETGMEIAPEVVVIAVSGDIVCPSVGVGVPVWSGGAVEPVVEPLLGAAMTESFPPPELDGGGGGGGGGGWPDGRTAYLQFLSSRTDWAPSPPVTGVRVTVQVCVIVPT